MIIGIGLTGAHRTGKSTLAKAYSEQTGCPLVLTSASSVFADLGIDPKADLDFDERLYVQTMILQAFVLQWNQAAEKGTFITDRTPIDLIAYTLADVQRQTLSPEQDLRLKHYLDVCHGVLNKFFQVLIVIPPAIKIVEEEGKAPGSYGYVEHIHNLVLGLAVGDRVFATHFYMPRRMIGVSQRVACVLTAVSKVATRHEKTMEEGQGLTLH